MTTATATPDTTTLVVAEDAPIGVQLWPTRSPKYARNFTLAQVEVIRNEAGTHVRWIYCNGESRFFALGEEVACQF